MARTLSDILPLIQDSAQKGVTPAALEKKLPKKLQTQLSGHLKSLLAQGLIAGPFKKYYFAPEHAPTVDDAAHKISSLLKESGLKLITKAALKAKLTDPEKLVFEDALQSLLAQGLLLKLKRSTSTYFLHRDVIAYHLNFTSPAPRARARSSPPTPDLTLERVLPVYQRLVKEQDGVPTVTLYALQQALQVTREQLHAFLLPLAKSGRVTIHPANTVHFPPEVIAAGIRLEGHSLPFVTVLLK